MSQVVDFANCGSSNATLVFRAQWRSGQFHFRPFQSSLGVATTKTEIFFPEGDRRRVSLYVAHAKFGIFRGHPKGCGLETCHLQVLPSAVGKRAEFHPVNGLKIGQLVAGRARLQTIL